MEMETVNNLLIPDSHLPLSPINESVPVQRGTLQFKVVQEMEQSSETLIGKRRRSVEVDNITSPMKRCRLVNFDVGESLSAIDRMMVNNPRFNVFTLKCGEFEFTAKSI
jgi:hypothetical protein